jgi:putative transposase
MVYPQCMSRLTAPVTVLDEQRVEITQRLRQRTLPIGQALRLRAVLLAAGGMGPTDIAERLDTSRLSVMRWLARFRAGGLPALDDRPKSGRPRRYDATQRAKIAAAACRPPKGQNRWTVRALAEHLDVPKSVVHGVLQRERIQPHRVRYYMHSTDPRFEERLEDIVGLYLRPPEHAVVLCVDEKTGIQALDRTQPLLPLRPGHVKRLSIEYKRNGVVSLFAALQVHKGTVHGMVTKRHTHAEFLDFLKQLNRAYQGRELHLVVDNLSTHTHARVVAWLDKHKNVRLHFTPTHASWLNQVELWLSILTRRYLRHGVFPSRQDLVKTIMRAIAEYNVDAKPFAWTYTGDPLRVM